ncbi:hypothetical protein MUK42_01168 [Musa troglodytarum]|uniref:Uncharacterized protein n=1 Tax=Musa troglodytarum TaxID=320322 RepID=A0A9E7K2H8_9LILI|nr:hypothetical protein MUK42_01168 [Musa troglodytarum]
MQKTTCRRSGFRPHDKLHNMSGTESGMLQSRPHPSLSRNLHPRKGTEEVKEIDKKGDEVNDNNDLEETEEVKQNGANLI